MNKLITHEDPYHIHKTLGLYCIGNYIYQYYLYFTRGYILLNTYTITPHILLHFSSFIFKVLNKRTTESKLSMFIWEELRLHAMIFSCRACFAILFPNYSYWFTVLAMMLADIVTKYFGTSGVSTVRGNHSKVGKRNIYKELYGSFFSISQMGASIITSGLFKTHSPIVIFSTLPPIQTSAFGMTLIRKNIINHQIWTIVYSLELGFTYFIWYKETPIFYLLVPLTILMYGLRRIGVSKYILWGSLFLIQQAVFYTLYN